MTPRHLKFLLPLSLVHAALLLFRIGRESLWLDEVMSLEAARGPWSEMRAFFIQEPQQHPLYYLLLRGWLVFGTSELALRSLSALFALAALWAIYFLAQELFDDLVARVAAVLLCFSPFWLYYGQEARMYSMLGFLAILSSLLLVIWLNRGRRTLLAAYAVVAILGAYTHFFFLFVLAAHLAFVLHRERKLTPAVTRLVLAQGIVGLAYLPWAVRLLLGDPSQPWKGAQHVVFGIPHMLLRFSLGYSELVANYEWKSRVWQMLRDNAVLLAFAVLCFGTLALVGLRTVVRRGGDALLVVWGAVLPPLLALIGSAVIILVGERYLLVSFPFYLLLLAVGMVALLRMGGRWRSLGVASIVVYALLMSHALRAYYFDPAFGKEQWADVARHLRGQSAPGDVIVVHRGYAIPNLRHYYAASAGQRLIRSDELKPEDLQAAGRLWLVVRGTELTHEYVAAMPSRYRVVSNTLFPKQSGIRVVLMVRS